MSYNALTEEQVVNGSPGAQLNRRQRLDIPAGESQESPEGRRDASQALIQVGGGGEVGVQNVVQLLDLSSDRNVNADVQVKRFERRKQFAIRAVASDDVVDVRGLFVLKRQKIIQ